MAEELKQIEEVKADFENPEEGNNEETQVSEQEKPGFARKIKAGLAFAGTAVGAALAVKIAAPAIESCVDEYNRIKNPDRKPVKQRKLEKKLKKAQERAERRNKKVTEIEEKLKEFEKPANPVKDDNNGSQGTEKPVNPEPTSEENK